MDKTGSTNADFICDAIPKPRTNSLLFFKRSWMLTRVGANAGGCCVCCYLGYPWLELSRAEPLDTTWALGQLEIQGGAVSYERDTPVTHPRPCAAAQSTAPDAEDSCPRLNESVIDLDPTPNILHPTTYTLQPTPYTLHPTPYTLHPAPRLTESDLQQSIIGSDVPGTPDPKP